MKIIEIDSNKCTGCMSCVLACSFVNTTAFSYENAVMKIVKDEPIELCQVCSCSSCTDKECIDACPFDAISLDESYGMPIIDYDKCTGCGLCAKGCHYEIIKIRDKKVYKCDFCGGSPSCVTSCIAGAIKVRTSNV